MCVHLSIQAKPKTLGTKGKQNIKIVFVQVSIKIKMICSICLFVSYDEIMLFFFRRLHFISLLSSICYPLHVPCPLLLSTGDAMCVKVSQLVQIIIFFSHFRKRSNVAAPWYCPLHLPKMCTTHALWTTK